MDSRSILGSSELNLSRRTTVLQDASALAIYSPAGIVVHTGDFKVDYTPVFGDAIDLQRFAEIGKKGVLALMCRQYQCGDDLALHSQKGQWERTI